MTTFRVAQECLDLGLRAGAILFRDVTIVDSPAELREAIDQFSTEVAETLPTAADIRATPEISAHYDILRRVGVKPRRRPPSTEKLLDLARSRQTLPAINALVDAYNLVSIQTRCSLGAHDLDRFAPPAELRLFRGDESFFPLGSAEPQPVKEGEFGYVDAEDRVLCRLDSLQADFSKVTSETTQVLLIVEATDRHQPEQIAAALQNSGELIERYCGGRGEIVARP